MQKSAERFLQVTSGRSEFEWAIRRDGFEIQGDGRYAIQSVGAIHLVAHYSGSGEVPSTFNEESDSDLLVLGEAVYLSTPSLHDGWVLFSPQEFASDWDIVQRLITARSPVNYKAVVDGLASGVEHTGAEEIDGDAYQHYRAQVDALALTNALADAYGSQGAVMLANRFQGPVTLDVWLDSVTLLPRRIVAQGQFTFYDGDTALTMRLDFADLNGQVDIPDPPLEAVTFAELVAGG